jgi:hypothetical protein
VADARAEVEGLLARREAITLELGGLSGVIEALSMPDFNARSGAAAGENSGPAADVADEEGDAVAGDETADDKLSDLAGGAMGETGTHDESDADADSETEASSREPGAEANRPAEQFQPSDETSAKDESQPKEMMGSE